MKKYILIILVAGTLMISGLMIGLGSSNEKPDAIKLQSQEQRVKTYKEMTHPIIVIAISERIETKNTKGNITSGRKASIILQDSKGVTVMFIDDEPYGAAFIASYKKGEVIINTQELKKDTNE